MPFTVEQFLQVFAEYNLDVWPTQMVLLAAGIVTALLLCFQTRTTARLAMSLLAALWIWSGVAYHWMHFARINPAAWAFGALFVAGAVPLFLSGRSIEIDADRPLRIAVGGAFVAYAILIYPAAAYLTGHVYPEVPTFGAPCPLVIFTLGILIAAKPPIRVWAAAAPLLWALIGVMAPLKLGMTEDFGLTFAAIALAVAAASEHMHPHHETAPV